MEIIKFCNKNYSKCSMCGDIFEYNKLFLCDGIIGRKRVLPFGKWKNQTCDKLMCKECKKNIAGYDFCNVCYVERSYVGN